jgi:hypothetical protein
MVRWGEISGGLHIGRGAVWYALLAAGCALLVWAAAEIRPSDSGVVTVTTGAHPAPSPAATPFYVAQPALPPRDAEVEQAGDRIAEVEVYLKKRQSNKALEALTRARHATAHALEARRRKGSPGDVLLATLKELDSVQRAIERGQYEDAHRQLVALDKNLDRINY